MTYWARIESIHNGMDRLNPKGMDRLNPKGMDWLKTSLTVHTVCIKNSKLILAKSNIVRFDKFNSN